jgi:hypothetical protein
MKTKPIILFAALALAACAKQEPTTTLATFLTVDGERSIAVDKNGNDGALYSVLVSSDASWVPMASADWISIVEKTKDEDNRYNGFSYTVAPNTAVTQRTAKVVVAAVGLPAVSITVEQAPGDAVFEVAEAQRNKTIAQEGGTVTVEVSANLEYGVSTLDTWCTISDITPTGFKLTAEANPFVASRNADIIVYTESDEITVVVKQSGIPLMQDIWFVESFAHWTVSGDEAVELTSDSYMPGATGGTSGKITTPTGGKYIKIKAASLAAEAFETSVTQTIVGLPAGSYRLSCAMGGYSFTTNTTDSICLIAIHDGVTEKFKLTPPGGDWTLMESPKPAGNEPAMRFTMSAAGDCTVGVYLKKTAATADTWGGIKLTYIKVE